MTFDEWCKMTNPLRQTCRAAYEAGAQSRVSLALSPVGGGDGGGR